MTATDRARPSARTVTASVTLPKFTPSWSASGGKPQSFQSPLAVTAAGRERSFGPTAGPTGRREPAPVPVAAAWGARTALFEVPVLAVTPPAKRSPIPVTKPSPVRSTGSSGSGSAVSTLPASAAAGGGAEGGWSALGGGGGSGSFSGSGSGSGG